MEFILCMKERPSNDVESIGVLKDMKDEAEAILWARAVCKGKERGFLVGLFTCDGDPLGGWKVRNNGTLGKLSVDTVRSTWSAVGQETYGDLKDQVI